MMMTMTSCGSEKDNIAKAENGVWFDRGDVNGDGKVDILSPFFVVPPEDGQRRFFLTGRIL